MLGREKYFARSNIISEFFRIFSPKVYLLLAKNMILKQCKGVHCVDLGENFQTHIFLQNFASMQPRTSSLKFARSTDPFNAVYHTAKVTSAHEGPSAGQTSAPSDTQGPQAAWRSRRHVSIWAAKKDAGWIWISNLFEFRTYLNCRTYTVPWTFELTVCLSIAS